jgi:hypothetical protein
MPPMRRALFLRSYSDSLRQASPRADIGGDEKGKQKLYDDRGQRKIRRPGLS